MLLDTHVALWLLDASPRLGPKATATIRAARRVHVSSISLTELSIKAMLGKVTVPADLSARLAAQGLALLSYSAAHADAIVRFDTLARHDPFDRMLLAQAAVEGFAFATADRRLLGLGLPWIVDATQ